MLTLRIDAARWRAHHRAVLSAERDLVPVVKGNGYGVGRARLFEEVRALESDVGVDLVAVGTYAEAREALAVLTRRVLVLTPWRAADATYDSRLVHTVSRLADVSALAAADRAAGPAHVLLEGLTTMRRHGVAQAQVGELVAAVRAAGDRLEVEGLALHQPIDRHDAVHPVEESAGWIEAVTGAGLPLSSVFVSHLEPAEVADLSARFPSVRVRPRVGTRLWLGDRGALRATATVLDAHAVRRGDRYGYRQRRAPSAGWIVVVGGGTANGIGLEAPRSPRGLVGRGRALALGGLEAGGLALSPYHWQGKQRWFAEPPHMQVSLLFLPQRVAPPPIGVELDVDVRMTISTFDEVEST